MKFKVFGIVLTLVFFALVSASHATIVINFQGIGNDYDDRTINITDFTVNMFQGTMHSTNYNYPVRNAYDISVNPPLHTSSNLFMVNTIPPESVPHTVFGNWTFFENFMVQTIPGVTQTQYTTSLHAYLYEQDPYLGRVHMNPANIDEAMIPLDGNFVILTKPDDDSIPYALDISTFHFYDFTDDQFQGDAITDLFLCNPAVWSVDKRKFCRPVSNRDLWS